ncbi:response regulator transcription factor [Streptomyces sp. b84]|uniref:response regulator transcription factor n=1 Tax=Streptomyces sp. b84 TaxID=1827631 RepID=UPI00117FE249|nr:response regulator transcription factor [Streptomyces sp. b84]
MTEELADRLRDADVGVKTEHRHIDRPILSGVAGGLLTDQELDALYLFARGRRQEIAEALRVSPETVGRLLHGARVVLRPRTLAVAPGQESGLLERPRGWTPARAGGVHRSSGVRKLGSWAAGQLGSWARNRSPQGGVRPAGRRGSGADG